MPCLDNRRLVKDGEPTDLIQFARTESMIPCQGHGRQPKLGVLPIAPDVGVHRLMAVETIEEERIRPWNIGNPRHVAALPDRMISGCFESDKAYRASP
jgi:hypothetical protein